jgi:hypothetical protein
VLTIDEPGINRELSARLTARDWLPLVGSAVLSLVIVVVLVVIFDGVSPYARPTVLEGLATSLFWLAAGVIGASSTIAALMLTTISLMQHLETRRMGPRFLFNLRVTVVAAMGSIACAVISLLLTIFPSTGSKGFSPSARQVDIVYYGMLVVTAVMVGSFAVVLTALYATVADVFHNLPRSWVEDILAEDEEREEAQAASEPNTKTPSAARSAAP